MASPDREVRAQRPARPGLFRRAPILVTGVPRSGTTWLARELARNRSCGLPGREPMNPRPGQFALGGTLQGWAALDPPTPRQVALLRRCYRGTELRTFSRYGAHQAAALLPWTHVIVKDPYALLSLPAIVRHTAAVPVLIYRHPGAVLQSYRRMGWRPSIAEIRTLAAGVSRTADDELSVMVEFWNFLHNSALKSLADVPDALVVSHAELAVSGRGGLEKLAVACGLSAVAAPTVKKNDRSAAAAEQPNIPAPGRLHGFERQPEEVARGWRSQLDEEDVDRLEEETAETWQALEARRLRVS